MSGSALIGRVGGLAVALGIGVVGAGMSGTAWASPQDSSAGPAGGEQSISAGGITRAHAPRSAGPQRRARDGASASGASGRKSQQRPAAAGVGGENRNRIGTPHQARTTEVAAALTNSDAVPEARAALISASTALMSGPVIAPGAEATVVTLPDPPAPVMSAAVANPAPVSAVGGSALAPLPGTDPLAPVESALSWTLAAAARGEVGMRRAAPAPAPAATVSTGQVVLGAASAPTVTSTAIAPSAPGRTSSEWRNYLAFAALKSDGTVVTWGDPPSGGDSSAVKAELTGVTQVYSAGAAFAALKSDGTVVTWGYPDDGGDSSAVKPSLTGVARVYSTAGAFAALKSDGTVVTWGTAGFGGDSSAAKPSLTGVTEIYSTDSAFAALKSDGTVVTWGDPVWGGDSSAAKPWLTGVVSLASPFTDDRLVPRANTTPRTSFTNTALVNNSPQNVDDFWANLGKGTQLAGYVENIAEFLKIEIPTAETFLLKFTAGVGGLHDVIEGIFKGDSGEVLKGIATLGTAVKLPGPGGVILAIGMAIIEAFLPVSEEEQDQFLEFRAKCMFHKGLGDLSVDEASQLVKRYTGFASVANVPIDYAKYHAGDFAGVHLC